MKKIISIAIILILYAATASAANPAMNAVREPLDRAMTILNDPQFANGQKEAEQKDLLWTCIDDVFNFVEVGKRALGKGWKKFKPEQRKEFCDVFAKVIGNAYLSRIQDGFGGETIDYLEMIPGKKPTKAVVKTMIKNDSRETPVDYSLLQKNGRWQVYDVKIEGISLVKNYRSQFSKILMNKKPDELIQRLKTKLEKQD